MLIILASLWLPLMLHILLPKCVNTWHWWGCFFLNYFIMFQVSLLNKGEITLIPAFLVLCVICYKGYSCKKQELIYIPLSYIFIALYNNLVAIFIEKFFHISVSFIETAPYVYYLYISVTVLSVISALFFKKILTYISYLLNNHYRKITLTLVIGNILLCTIVFLINNWAARINHFPDEVELTNMIIFCTYTFLLCFITVIVLKFFRDKEKMDRERQQYENLKEYSAQIETMYTNLRAFKHDYINILTSMSEYLNEQDYKGLECYFKEHILPTREKLERDNYRLNQLKHIKDLALKGLISTKLIYAHEIGIDVYIDILDDMEHISMREIDLSRIMGIFLDNAIEAALETEKKEIKFCMIKEEKHIAIILMNTFVNHNLPISQLEKNGFSTKGENRGLGLATVKEILSSYHNIYKTTQIQGEYFCQKLEIENA